jgi:hypothetical protein
MMSTLSIHMWLNPVAKQSHLLKSTCLDHIWLKFAARESPPTRGTFRATVGQSPLHDKVLQRGAHFGPHLVEVRCMTKSPNEGLILGHIWSKSAAWQSPPMRGTFWATFGQSPLRDKVLQWGAHFGPHLVEVHSETKSSDEGHHCFFLPHLAIICCVTTLSVGRSWVSFSGNTWPKSAEWHFFLLC